MNDHRPQRLSLGGGETMRVAWIGLGSMGAPMALSIVQAGHTLTGYARRPAEHDAIRAAGGTVIDDVSQAVRGAEVVCVNLFSAEQICEVLVERQGLAAMSAGAILVVHSTVSAAFVRELATMRPDIDVVDAGFSGGPQEAAEGRLTLLVGGTEEQVARVRPVFDAHSAYIAHVGPLGSGMTLKVINNLTFGAHVAIARDALRLVEEEGLDAGTAAEALLRGSAASFALTVLSRNGDAEASVARIRPYLDKDVAIARAGATGMELGTLDAATRDFG
ncbi:NAD(P)-binding domain-containing protein [Novosphingobium sp. RD2P27]|uniref:NAD(P)-binding domain-containing protein n=1 Tax=Novosphingobium kalidii TaxID=3230299 RepID=A0ABV2D5B9_9SPHN